MGSGNLDDFIDFSIRSLPLPKLAEEGLIFAKNYFKDEDNREKVIDFVENILSKGTNFLKDIWKVKDIVKNEGIEEGIGKAVDIAIDNAKEENIISKNIAKTLKEGKVFIVENFLNQEKIFKDQEKILTSINENYIKWEELINNNNFEKAEKIGETIKRDCEKILPTIELIKKVENIDNTLMLYKSKENNVEFTELEKEILNKIA